MSETAQNFENNSILSKTLTVNCFEIAYSC